MTASTATVTTADFTIEPGRANDLAPCECCGATTQIIRGFVYQGGTARAVYLVRWSLGAKHHDADVAVSIGGWCDADQRSRKLVALSLRQMKHGPAFMVVDAEDMPWGHEEELGTAMNRSDIVETRLASEVFAILDAVAVQDERVLGWRLKKVSGFSG